MTWEMILTKIPRVIDCCCCKSGSTLTKNWSLNKMINLGSKIKNKYKKKNTLLQCLMIIN